MACNHRLAPSLTLAAAVWVLAAVAAPSLSAQTTFTACRVPDVGAIYMIGLEGLPEACLDPSHVEFSWSEGGSVADGSVTTAKLADGAVASAKLAEAAVTETALAEGAVTQSAIAADAVDSLSIRNGSILGEDLRSGTVGSAQIGDRSIAGTDVGFGALLAENFAEGAVGAIVQAAPANTGPLSTTPTSIGEISYVAPAEGVALILLTGTARLEGENTRVVVGIGGSPGSTTYQEVSVGYETGTGTANLSLPFSTMAAVQIGVGGISRYYFSASVHPNDNANPASLEAMRAVLVYVPDGM